MFKCPYTDKCKAETLVSLSRFPDLIPLIEQRPQCSERDAEKAKRCAQRLGYEKERDNG